MAELSEENMLTHASRVFNVDFSTSDDGVYADMILPGFSYCDFNRTGHLSVWSVTKLMEINRLFVTMYSRTAFHDQQTPDILGVVVAQTLHFSRKLFDDASINYPMRYLFRPGHLGRSSLSLISELQDIRTRDCLGTNHRTLVYLDVKTRRPVSVPRNLRDAYQKHAKGQPLNISIPPLPDNHYTYQVMVTPGDEDHLRHTNSNSYFRYCLDGATEAALAGNFRQFPVDMCLYPVKDIDVLYKGETFASDTLDVYIWEDTEDIMTLHFHIDKQNTRIASCSISFYPMANSNI